MQPSDSAYNLPPFPAFPSIERFVGLGSVQDAVERIERSIRARDAISVVIGPPGTGKTLISEVIASRHQNSHQVITLGEIPLPDSDSFLRRVLHQAGGDIRNAPGGDLQLALFDHICLGEQSDRRLLLLIDEAQSLTSDLLETIRTLTNLTRDGVPRLSVVMFGGNPLDELLIAPSMDGFRQRISTRCYLHPLNHEETTWYINQTIRGCDCDPESTITADAISAVHHACSGVPRLINQLLTYAIDFAAEKDEYLITDRIIDQSWAEVQQLPSPMIDEPEISVTASTVEFGELDSFDLPSDNERTPQKTDKPLDETWADPHTANTTGETEPDANDTYDFQPDGQLAIPTEDFDSAEFEPSAGPEADITPDLHTEVWDDNDELELHEGCKEHSTQNNTDLPSPTIDEPLLDLDDLGSPSLHYPQLASPALETAEESHTDELSRDLPEPFATPPTNEELFGNFDAEKEIDIHTTSTHIEPPTQKPAATIETVLPQEVVIHQEIIATSDVPRIADTEQIQYCDDAHQIPNKMHFHAGTTSSSSHNISFEDANQSLDAASVDSATLDFHSTNEGNPLPLESADHARHSHDETTDTAQHPPHTEPETNPKEDFNHLHHDDSDILIIEDEVDIHRIDGRQNPLNRSPHSINFQRMLKRMRLQN